MCNGADAADAARALTADLAAALGEPTTWQFGVSKVFIRQPFASRLMHWAEVRKTSAVHTVERAVSARIRRSRDRAATALQHAWSHYKAVIAGRVKRVLMHQTISTMTRWRAHMRRAGHVSRMRSAAPQLQSAVRRWLQARHSANSPAVERPADRRSPL